MVAVLFLLASHKICSSLAQLDLLFNLLLALGIVLNLCLMQIHEIILAVRHHHVHVLLLLRRMLLDNLTIDRLYKLIMLIL